MGIYVEILIRSSMHDLWQKTQRPDLHEQWDLRFTDIEYLPRPDESAPQRFLYATRIGFGLGIRGEGESLTTREGDYGRRTSALRFWSDDRKSLIREGSGYWQYIPQEDRIRFLTWYDDSAGRFRIEVNVHNRVWGPLFGYRGSFEVEWRSIAPGQIPPDVKPQRLERRE